MIPLTVDWLIWSYDVHVDTLRLVHPPLDVRLMPAAESWAAAWASVSLVTACAGEGSASNVAAVSAANAATSARMIERWCMTAPDSSRAGQIPRTQRPTGRLPS